MVRAALIVLVVASACGGSTTAATRPSPGGDETASETTATTPSDSHGGEVASLVGTSECASMIDHILEIQLAEMRARNRPEAVPTPEQVEKIRAGMMKDVTTDCVSRPDWDCVMAATDATALAACASPS